MRKRLVFAAITALALLSAFLVGCGNSSTQMNAGMGSVALFGGDAPVCSVLSFEVTITGVTLTPQGGGTPVTVLSSADAQRVDFASLTGFKTLLNLSSAPAGSYSQVTITLADPQITILDTTQNPPAPTPIPTTLTTSSVTVNIVPVFTIEAGGSTGLNLDFRLRRSIQVDPQGQVTGTVNPVFHATPSVITTVSGSFSIDEFHGTVQSVNTTSSDPNFIGSFNLERPSGRVFEVKVKSSTEFDRISGLSALQAGMFVEVEFRVDPQGNIVAKEVELEEQVNIGFAAFLGVVTAVQRDPSTGNATQFTLFVREEFPNVEGQVPLRSNLTVNLSSLTIFRIGPMAQAANEAGLAFDASTLGVGQHVAAIALLGSNPQSGVSALGVVLRKHGYVGNFQTLLAAGSDGKTGGFTFVLCSPVLEGQPVTVVTFADTMFENGLTDLNSLTTTDTLAVRGPLFYLQSPMTINGIAISAPGWVIEAKDVVKLD